MHRQDVYKEIANLHYKYINQGFLTSLGIPFLTLLYEAIDADIDSVLIIEKVDQVVIGYVAGSSSMRSIYRELIKRFPRLIFSLVPSFFSPLKIYKILEILLFSRQYKLKDTLPDEELLSIVVDQNNRGQGYSDKLFNKLCSYFRARNASGFRIVVGKSLLKAHSFYIRLGSIPLKEVVVHKGETSVIYLKSLN